MPRQFTRIPSLAVLICFVALMAWGVLAGQSVRDTSEPLEAAKSDINLYIAITERVIGGEGYYQAAISEQTNRGYPVQPATAVRTPVTTTVISVLGADLAFALLLTLLASVFLGAVFQFEKLTKSRGEWVGALLVLALAAVLFGPLAIYYQETWAVLLLFLSLLTRKSSLAVAVVLALVACAFRELALPFIFAMALFELIDRNRRAALVWAAAGIGYVALYGLHVVAVAHGVEEFGQGAAVDSPGWLAFGGWPFIVGSVRSVTVLSALPLWVTAIVTPLALLGWLMRKSEKALPFTFAIASFIIPFLFIGRPNNNYWALLYALLLLPGLAFSFSGIKALIIGVRGTKDATTD